MSLCQCDNGRLLVPGVDAVIALCPDSAVVYSQRPAWINHMKPVHVCRHWEPTCGRYGDRVNDCIGARCTHDSHAVAAVHGHPLDNQAGHAIGNYGVHLTAEHVSQYD